MNKKEFETLLLHKAELEKECLEIEERYYLAFGEELAELLRVKLDVALLRKKIAYCQRKINAGMTVDEEEMEKEAHEGSFNERAIYLEALSKAKTVKELMDAPRVSVGDMEEIKKTFRLLMKLTHPDMHPEWQSDPLCGDIYQKGLKAYKGNDLKTLKELYALAMLYFSDKDFEIDDIEGRAEETKGDIERILTNRPYTYLEILENPEKEKGHHEEISKERKEFETLLDELNERLLSLLPKRGSEA